MEHTSLIPNFSIRTVAKDDWVVIQRLNNEVFQADKQHDDDLDLDWPFSNKGIQYYQDLANGIYGHCFIAEIESQPVGYIALAKKDFGYRKSLYVEVENIGVTPAHRGKGVGTKLIVAATNWAKEQNIHKLYVAAYWKNTKARDFYKRNGFYEVGVEFEKQL